MAELQRLEREVRNLPGGAPENTIVRTGDEIGFPYDSSILYDNPDINQRPIPVGSRGKVLGLLFFNGFRNYLVQITLPFENPQRIAWIPRSHIVIGTARRYGDVYFPHQDLVLKSLTIPPRYPESQFARAIDGLYLAFNENAASLGFLPPHFVQIIRHDDRRHHLINEFMMGMDKEMLKILNRKDFALEEILSVADDVDKPGQPNTRHGVYLITYQKRKDPKLIYQYAGKSGANGGFANRAEQHKEATTAYTKSNHYKAAYEADRQMVAICYIPQSDEMRSYFEQTMVSLLELYCPAVLHYQPVLIEKDLDPAEEDNVAKWSNDREQAYHLHNIASDSFIKSGWPGGCSRENYGCDGGGLNWKSPIAEGAQAEQIIYTVVRIPDENIDLYYRPAVRVTQGNAIEGRPQSQMSKKISIMQENQYIRVRGGYGKFHPVVGSEGPPADTWVHPVFEVNRNGKPHPKAWSRLPVVGPWTKFYWEFARSWALRLHWEEGSQWRSCYIQATHVLDPRKGQYAVASHNTFAQGVAVAAFLTRRAITTNTPLVWMYDYGLARLKEQSFHWLTQTYKTKDVPEMVSIGRPRQLTMQQIGQELALLGLNVSQNWQGWDRDPGIDRTCCDCCYVTHIRTRTFNTPTGIATDVLTRGYGSQLRGCVRKDGTNQCTPCYNRGLPCTWTFALRTVQLDDPRVTAFRPMDPAAGTVLDMDPDLGFHRMVSQHGG